ncbi:hypothetical protein CDD83_4299 [Cordyceps sp. RAO-2017]|nr:hypothetical protein CDD83_4299 [Cordyceps sp. RAO-2017]
MQAVGAAVLAALLEQDLVDGLGGVAELGVLQRVEHLLAEAGGAGLLVGLVLQVAQAALAGLVALGGQALLAGLVRLAGEAAVALDLGPVAGLPLGQLGLGAAAGLVRPVDQVVRQALDHVEVVVVGVERLEVVLDLVEDVRDAPPYVHLALDAQPAYGHWFGPSLKMRSTHVLHIRW